MSASGKVGGSPSPIGQVQEKKLTNKDIQWAEDLLRKASDGYIPTKAELTKFEKIYSKAQAQPSESTKGLLDYPKDLLVGLTQVGFKMFARNEAELKQDVKGIKDNFKASYEGLKNGLELRLRLLHLLAQCDYQSRLFLSNS